MNVLRQFFNPWILLGSVLIGVLLIGAAFGVLVYTQPQPTPFSAPTAAVAVIPAPTLTPRVPTPAPVTPTATQDLPPAPPSGVLVPGALVQIAGTGGEGLNLRATPGLSSNIQYLGFEAEVFTIQSGPEEADGLVWWYIVGFSDESRAGWAASNFLAVVQAPE